MWPWVGPIRFRHERGQASRSLMPGTVLDEEGSMGLGRWGDVGWQSSNVGRTPLLYFWDPDRCEITGFQGDSSAG